MTTEEKQVRDAENETLRQRAEKAKAVVQSAQEWRELHCEAVRINHDETMPYEAFLHAMTLADSKRNELFDLLDAYRQGGGNNGA